MHTDYTSKHTERFWSKVDLSNADEEFSCWNWTAYKNPKGYGRILWQGSSRLAHRLVYVFAFGDFPADLRVCHHCDNPSCVNPNHLFLGTDTDNVRDRELKGRGNRVQQFDEQNGQCKLSNAQVAEIRQLYAAGGITHLQLAEKFGTSRRHVGRIVNRERRS